MTIFSTGKEEREILKKSYGKAFFSYGSFVLEYKRKPFPASLIFIYLSGTFQHLLEPVFIYNRLPE